MCEPRKPHPPVTSIEPRAWSSNFDLSDIVVQIRIVMKRRTSCLEDSTKGFAKSNLRKATDLLHVDTNCTL